MAGEAREKFRVRVVLSIRRRTWRFPTSSVNSTRKRERGSGESGGASSNARVSKASRGDEREQERRKVFILEIGRSGSYPRNPLVAIS